jgi:signal transduction histidine kinase
MPAPSSRGARPTIYWEYRSRVRCRFPGEKSSLNLFCPRKGLALFSDENLLPTLLRNLVSNALKYTAHGGVLISIRRRGDLALIQVWDTGIGIAPEQTESIFEEYFQVGNPERDRAKGVGYLSIVSG